ncbi:hypothetical protein [Megamonas funiformis]|uniref:hypothetical protein n=1 Tax=Megamonas funiformis TaxID=437897 RepID=UPI0026DB1FCD|nr:hypothetical protein [Megamonas funiformis]
MKSWSRSENYIFNDMLRKSEQLITELVQDEEDFKDIVTIERIANILIIRLRKFLKVMDDEEIYNMLKEMQSLKKMRAPQKHKLVEVIRKFWN